MAKQSSNRVKLNIVGKLKPYCCTPFALRQKRGVLAGNDCTCHQAERFGKDSADLGEEMKKGRETVIS